MRLFFEKRGEKKEPFFFFSLYSITNIFVIPNGS
jgi:hypothetical protein